jgi:NADPH:quinone reductase-like Zn-dependent oxidoreductase
MSVSVATALEFSPDGHTPEMTNTNTGARAIPATMQAIVIDAYGGGDALHLADIAIPPTAADEVLIRVSAAGVGIWDVKQRDGDFGRGATFPLVLGAECSGEVVRFGSDVRRDDLALGDTVYSYFMGAQGAYAEYVNVKHSAVVRKPARLLATEAAAVPVDAITAYQGLFDELQLKTGQTIFIAGASGGVGTMAIQMARAAGATVVGSTSTGNQDYVRSLGAETVVDYTKGDVIDMVRKTYPNGVDAAIDCVGGPSARTTIRAVRDGGRFVELTGEDVGSPRGIAVGHVQSQATIARLTAVSKMFDDGSLRVFIERTFPLNEARAAQELVAKRRVRGKVVLTVAD